MVLLDPELIQHFFLTSFLLTQRNRKQSGKKKWPHVAGEMGCPWLGLVSKAAHQDLQWRDGLLSLLPFIHRPLAKMWLGTFLRWALPHPKHLSPPLSLSSSPKEGTGPSGMGEGVSAVAQRPSYLAEMLL